MAKCKTCGKTIRVPAEWGIGSAVRKHYWAKHPEVMERTKADRDAEANMSRKRTAARR